MAPRLAPFGEQPLDRIVVLAAAASAGAFLPMSPAVSAIAIGVAAAVIAQRSRWLAAIAIGVVVLASLRARGALEAHASARAWTVVDGRWPARCSISGEVVTSPVLVGDAYRIDVEGDLGEGCPSRRARIGLYVAQAIAPPLARGDHVDAVASLAPPYRFVNDGPLPSEPALAHRGIVLSGSAEDVVVTARGWGARTWIDRLRAILRARIRDAFPSETEGMARALVLGEDDLASDDRHAFRTSGLAHLLAVSGMHLVLVIGGFTALLRFVLIRFTALSAGVDPTRWASAVALPVTWIYADLAGGSGSAVRAAWMTSTVLFVRVLARRPEPWRALGLSVLAMCAVDALAPYDLSFLLSAAATAGLLGIAPRIHGLLASRLPFAPRIIMSSLAASTAASLACAPIIACMSPELPVLGIVANLVAVPVGELAALPLCFLHAAAFPWPSLARGAATAAGGALAIVRLLARLFAMGTVRVPAPTAGELAALGEAAFVSAFVSRGRLLLGAVALVLLVFFEVAARRRPHDVMRVTFLDVGQGDAALIELPDGRAMLVDGGGLVGSPIDVGERVVAPFLRARRRTSIDVVVLSHPHPDHFGGLAAALAGVKVGELWDTGQGEAEGLGGSYAALLATLRARGTPVRGPPAVCGRRELGGATIEVFAPCPLASSDRGPNDNSFVFRVRHGRRAILFAGDAEAFEESNVVAAQPDLHADVLKVGHHGSRTSSTPAFLRAVEPSVAVISSGVRNRFGHPHASTLDALNGIGARIFRTDRQGQITVTTDGETLAVDTR